MRNVSFWTALALTVALAACRSDTATPTQKELARLDEAEAMLNGVDTQAGPATKGARTW
jgi:hypothetical protein